MSKGVAIVSGGMDSVTLAYLLKKQEHEVVVVSFDYGQRHKKELEYASKAALKLGFPWFLVDNTSIGSLLTGSALTDKSVDVPLGHYAEESMKATVVPNRNAIMLSQAWGIMVANGGDFVAAAMHAGDHPIYPDCRPSFIGALESALRTGTEGFSRLPARFEVPFINLKKEDIVAIGFNCRVPFEETWSCYQGLEKHCGKCGTCVERKEAFVLSGIPDPTEYMTEADLKTNRVSGLV